MSALLLTLALMVAQAPEVCEYRQWHETIVIEGRVVSCTYIIQRDCSLVRVCT